MGPEGKVHWIIKSVKKDLIYTTANELYYNYIVAVYYLKSRTYL